MHSYLGKTMVPGCGEKFEKTIENKMNMSNGKEEQKKYVHAPTFQHLFRQLTCGQLYQILLPRGILHISRIKFQNTLEPQERLRSDWKERPCHEPRDTNGAWGCG